MNGVHGFARLLASSALTGEQQEYVNAILVSTDSLLSVINDILDYVSQSITHHPQIHYAQHAETRRRGQGMSYAQAANNAASRIVLHSTDPPPWECMWAACSTCC